MLTPYDLGNLLIAENCYKVKVDDLVSKALKDLKLGLIQSQIDTLGTAVTLTSSKTRFNGERIWFLCPNCQKRVGTIYKHPLEERVGCRICLNLKYKKQRFKGMVEASDY